MTPTEIHGVILDPEGIFEDRGIDWSVGPIKKVFYGSVARETREAIGRRHQDFRGNARESGYQVLISWARRKQRVT